MYQSLGDALLAVGLKNFVGNFQRAKKSSKVFWKKYCLDHYWLTGSFFFSHVLMVSVDIVTDILQAKGLFTQGHFNWGLATLGFVLVRDTIEIKS